MDKDTGNKNGCAFGKITRERVDNFIKMFDEFRDNEFKHLSAKMDQLTSQMGRRPSWAISTIVWILSSLAVALLVRAFILR